MCALMSSRQAESSQACAEINIKFMSTHVTSVVTNLNQKVFKRTHNLNIFNNNTSVYSMSDSFHRLWLPDRAHSFYTCYDLGSLQPMYLQGKKSRRFTKAYYLDT